MRTLIRTVDDAGNVLGEEIVEEKSPWMSIADAAAYLDVTEHTIHKYARKKKIKKYRISDFHTVRVKRSEIEGLLVEMPVDEDPEPAVPDPA